jgi:hypothetical protein
VEDISDEGMKRNPHLRRIALSAGVLWDENGRRAWVDTDGDGSFQNQRALKDYGETHDTDWFGRIEEEDDNRIPFGVKIDRSRHAAFLSIASGGHGAYVAGPLAGNRLTGGLFDGAAPSAQLIDVRSRPRVPAFLTALARKDVDVVNWAGGWAQPFRDNGEEDFQRRLMERAIALYNKPMACTCGMANALNVQDYQTPEMLRRNKRLVPPYFEGLITFPYFTRDGFQNTILVPSTSLVTDSRYTPDMFVWENGQRYNISGDFVNPPAPAGYMVGANPSPTIPVMSGILADIISEARRQHIRYDASRLTQAVRIGARRLENFSTSEQMFAVVDAGGAWDQFAKMSAGDDPANPQLTSFTVARLEDGKLSPVYGFHADVPKPGGDLSGEVWITRRGGYAGARQYALLMVGDDGTYRLLDENVTLVRDRATRIRLTAKLTPGMHVAFLQLKDAQADVVMYEVPLTVRVPDLPEMVAPWVEKYQATIPPRRFGYQYLRFDGETQAARYTTHMPFPGNHGLFDLLPDNPRINNEEPTGTPIDPAHHVGAMQNIEMIASNTQAETKVIFRMNRAGAEYEGPTSKPAPDVPLTVTLQVEKFAVGFERGSQRSVWATNKQAAIEGKVEFYDAKLSSTDSTGSGPHAMATLTRNLPAKLSQWRISVTPTSRSNAAADAFLMDCTSGPVLNHFYGETLDKKGCSVEKQQPVTAQGAEFVVDDPKQGDWQIVVRSREAQRHAISYRVREAQLASNPATQDHDAKHASGDKWSVHIPAGKSQAQYVAFRIAGEPIRILDDEGQEPEEYASKAQELSAYDPATSALRIAVTPLTPSAP